MDLNCFCTIPPKDIHTKHQLSDWDEVLQIPGVANVALKGNDSIETIHTCKILLLSLGPKIEALLSQKRITLAYPFSVVRSIHNFALTGQLCYQERDIETLLKAAHDFELEQIKKLCGDILLSMINGDSVNRIYKLSKELLCQHYTDKVKKILMDNICDFASSDIFLRECTPDLMKELIKSDELNSSEEDVFSILLAWAKVNSDNAKHFQSLVQFVRFGLLEPDFFNNVVKPSELLKNNDFVDKAQSCVKPCYYTEHTLRFRPKKFRLPRELGNYHHLRNRSHAHMLQ
jgi:hypothetical protein